MRVPLVDLAAQHAEVAEEVRAGIDEVFAKTAFIGGPQVDAFEHEYAEYIGVRHCVGAANGTDSLELALRAVGVDAGSEVILPVNTFIATAEAVSRIGATPVFVDVDPEFLLIDPAAVDAAISSRTTAIVPVHLFGQVAPMRELLTIAQRAGVPIVEDAAQSQGAAQDGVRAGRFGAAAATSFYPGKNLGAAGDAGAVLTDDAAVERRARTIASHGGLDRYVHDVVGFNSRLDALQAVVLRAKLARLDSWNDARRAAAARYTELLSSITGIQVPGSRPGNIDVWHLYVIRLDRRDCVLEFLTQAGIGAGIHYPSPLHLTDAYGAQGAGPGSFPIAERAAGRILSLPLFPHITPAQQEYVVDTVKEAMK